MHTGSKGTGDSARSVRTARAAGGPHADDTPDQARPGRTTASQTTVSSQDYVRHDEDSSFERRRQAAPSVLSRASPGAAAVLPSPITAVEWGRLRFRVMDAPSATNLEVYVDELLRAGVHHLVRLCDPTYAREAVEARGIVLHDMIFADGNSPPDAVIAAWLGLVNSTQGSDPSAGPIAVHCVAGLGRAPVLVAIALIEDGMAPLDAVAYIRERRRGAINSRQLRFLEAYRPRSRPRCVIQ